jgi:uncharacterized protein (TIGR03067 family)
MSQPCPSQERWKEHLDGNLPADEEAVLTEHLDGCAACRKTLETLAGGSDSLLGVARLAGEATEPSTPALHEVLAQFQSPTSETQAEPTGARDDSLAFLTPSVRPGFLGRLGPYEIQAVIGKGGFGIVLKAFDERLHRVVAIKVLSPAFAANGAARKRFIREARAAAAVKNEHVVGIHDVQEEGQPPYLVMEYIEGVSLQDKLDKAGAVGVKEILRIGTQIAEGLAAAHKQGLVHRDIKPANILLENGVERVKITDFGLARAVDDASVTQSGTVAGTPMYMSPEQAEGLPIDHRSDLFSLGTVLYAMCTGHPPFRASGTHAVLKRVIDASPRPIREINNEIPDWLEAIVAKLHAKKPEDRFQSAKEVAELLGQHLAHLQQPNLAPRPAPVAAPSAVGANASDASATPSKPAPGTSSNYWPTLIGVVLGAAAGLGLALKFPEMMPDTEGDRANLTGMIQSCVQGLFLGAGFAGLVAASVRKYWEIRNVGQIDGSGMGRWALAIPVATVLCVVVLWSAQVTIHWPGADEWLWPWSLHAIFFGAAGVFAVAALAVSGLAWQRRRPLFGSVTIALGLVAVGLAIDGQGAWQRKANFAIGANDPDVRVTIRSHDGAFEKVLQPDDKIRLPAGAYEVKIACGPSKEIRTVWVFGQGQPRKIDEARNQQTFHLELSRDRHVALSIEVAPRMPANEPGWVQLFNGKNKDGWTTHADQADDWNVEDGNLVGRGRNTSFLFSTRGNFDNFHLLFEAKLNPKGNSGVFVRAPFELPFKTKWGSIPGGFHAQFGANESTVTAGVLQHAGPKPSLTLVSIPTDTWFTEEIIAEGDRIILKVNGVTTTDFRDPERKFTKGHIALQAIKDAGTVHFRKIEIRELPALESIPALAFDGKSSVVHATAATPLNTDALTVEAWMSPTATGTYQHRELPWTGHVYRNDTPGQGLTAIGLTYEKQEDGSLRWVFRIIAEGKYTAVTSTDRCELGKWAHVAAVINGRKQMALYVNGRQQGASVPIAGLKDPVQCVPFRIGGGDIGKGSFVGEFRAFRLSASARYDKDFSPPISFERDAKTAALFRFDEGEGDVLRDWSGNAYHGAVAAPHWLKARPPTYKDDKERLQGHWVAESVDNGRQLPKEVCDQFTLTFTGSKMKMRALLPDPSHNIFHLDETAKPKQIDLINEEERRGTFGIYRFDGDRLVLCMGEDDQKDRPTEFTSKGGVKRMLGVFKRAVEPSGELEKSAPFVFVDPDGDCRWQRDAKRITITVPAGDHHFSAKKANLPRLLQDVERDFAVEVKLPPLTLVPVNALAWGEHLMVWKDDQNVLAVQRVLSANDGKQATCVASSVNFHDGKPVFGVNAPLQSNRALDLKIERVGAQIKTFYREEGKAWREIQTFVVTGWPQKLRVGLAVSNGSKAVFAAHFDDFRVHHDTGWVQLFNGKDLAGWQNHPDQPGDWKVDKGMLVGRGRMGLLYSERGDYGDYDLHVEAKVSNGGYGGVFIRTPDFPPIRKQVFEDPKGHRVVLSANSKHEPSLNTGSLKTWTPKDYMVQAYPNGTPAHEWFTLDILTRGSEVIVRADAPGRRQGIPGVGSGGR